MYEWWIEFIWLRTGTSVGLLWSQQWASWFHKRQEISCPSKRLSASQEGLCYMELVTFQSQ